MIEIIDYDDHSSAADAVRAFQRAANQDHAHAVIASYISEVVLALEPWSGRLKLPMITPGAASATTSPTVSTTTTPTSNTPSTATSPRPSCPTASVTGSRSWASGGMHMKTAVVMSEDAAWTIPLDEEYLKCLPKIGLKVLDHIRLSPDTTDFTPIFNKIEGQKPDVIVTGISHVGVQPTVQWHDQQVPLPMIGISSQATTSTFYKDTNGATEGVIYQTISAPEVAVTPKMIPFTEGFEEALRQGHPGLYRLHRYDEVYYIADAIKRAGSTDPDKMVTALEKT